MKGEEVNPGDFIESETLTLPCWAHALEMMSELEAAAALLQAALAGSPQASQTGELSTRLRWMVLQNLADYLSKSGRFEEAGQVLAEHAGAIKGVETDAEHLLSTGPSTGPGVSAPFPETGGVVPPPPKGSTVDPIFSQNETICPGSVPARVMNREISRWGSAEIRGAA